MSRQRAHWHPLSEEAALRGRSQTSLKLKEIVSITFSEELLKKRKILKNDSLMNVNSPNKKTLYLRKPRQLSLYSPIPRNSNVFFLRGVMVPRLLPV